MTRQRFKTPPAQRTERKRPHAIGDGTRRTVSTCRAGTGFGTSPTARVFLPASAEITEHANPRNVRK
jgi:hypothetical protein